VKESKLTGIQLSKGALELTDDDFSDEMVDLLEDVSSINGRCQYHEMLNWKGDPTALGANNPSTLRYKRLDIGKVDHGSSEPFSLTSARSGMPASGSIARTT
jgi:hypothetical protein